MRMIIGMIMMIILFFVLFCSRSAVPAESQACRDHGALLSNEGERLRQKVDIS